MDLGNERREYGWGRLDEGDLPGEPFALLQKWINDAREAGCPDATAMALSTVERGNQPSSRVVLLKKIEDHRLIFYTNYHSRKSKEIRYHNRVAALFFWAGLERQVKVAGIAHPVDDSDSDRYFATRPFESKIAAWASPQGEEVPDRAYLEQEYNKYLVKFRDKEDIPRPAYWGGIAIRPLRMEFWQGGEHRLHDRIQFTFREDRWNWTRLAP